MPRILSFLAVVAIAAAAVGCPSHGGSGGGGGGSPTPSVTPTPDENVLEHHHAGNRRGVYQQPALTSAHAAGLLLDSSFSATTTGATYAQPLYFVDPVGGDLVISVTEQNIVTAFRASSGTVAWQKTLAPPMPNNNDAATLPCGNINPLGITGTPVIDRASKSMFVDAMTDAGTMGNHAAEHKLYALSLADGSTKAGWPVDMNTTVSSGGLNFDSTVQNQRGALALVNGIVYVPFGGHYGDCGNYYGWVVGVDIADPTSIGVWRTRDQGVAIWSPGGIATDGTSLFVATGNGFGGPTWGDSEAVIRLSAGPVFNTADTHDYYVPTNWPFLDANDIDLGGTQPVLVDLPGAQTPLLAVALGKDGKMYVVDRTNLGGIGGELFQATVANEEIINASAAYTTPAGTYVVFKGQGANCPAGQSGRLTAMRLLPTHPVTAETAWCADWDGASSPAVTQTAANGGDTIVWTIGTEGEAIGGDHLLHGFDGDTGAVVFSGGTQTMAGALHRYITPIAAKGRVFVAGDGAVYAFK